MKNISRTDQVKTLLLIISGFIVLMTSSNLRAELDMTGMYGGVFFSDSQDKFESQGSQVKENRGHFKLKVGKEFNDHFAAEGHLGLTSNSDTSQGIITYGGYGRVYQGFEKFKVYGLLGFGGIHAYDDNVDDVDESSVSYGAGMEIFGSKHVAISIEYVSVLDKSINGGDLTFDTLGIGFSYYFIDDTSRFNRNRNKIPSIRY